MPAAEFLAKLADLWRAERLASRAQFDGMRRGTSLRARVARGLAIAELTVSEWRPAARDRTRVLLSPPAHVDLDDVKLGPGDPVVLWKQSPDDPRATRGVIQRRERHDLWVMIDGDVPDAILESGGHLDALAPEATFDRGDRAIARAQTAKATSALHRIVQVMVGDRPAASAPPPTWQVIDAALDEAQRAAVTAALAAHDVALIHGPPGTGKTRTLVEIIRQLVGRGERVLCTAASNVAVDNLGERLAGCGLNVVRLGHPARVSAALEDRTLDALVTASDGARLARELADRARELRRGNDLRGEEGRALRQEIVGLLRDARAALAQAEAYVVERAEVVLATCTGADAFALRTQSFPTVIIDEATQAPDPIALVAMARGERVILAGDPHQLPPTVIDPAAARAGLGTTFFERMVARREEVSLLVQQHRMHADIMRFPSESKYGGRLVAAPAVAAHTLADLGVAPDPERGHALWFLDTAGKDWTDRRGGLDADDDEIADPSTWNPEQAVRTAREVRRLIARGLPPSDIAVIAAYDAQVRHLRSLLTAERDAGLEIRTVDGFQGREKEAVVVDTVRSNPDGDIGFLADTRRMNVALTRARRFLLVLGDSATLGAHAYYAALIAAMDDLGAHGSAWADDG